MKIATVLGARPQFIKAAAVSRAVRSEFSDQIEEFIVHTGQHFDDNMSQVFFDELEIPRPKHHFALSGGTHGQMTGKMLEAIESVLIEEKPDWVLIYGDTNSTLAGALAAAKLHIPVAHVEAGLRSFNMRMPEEVNRIVADRLSTLLFCPTRTAVDNLAAEALKKGVHDVGDVMYDVALHYRDKAQTKSGALQQLGLEPKRFALATVHRAENTDDANRLNAILTALDQVALTMKVVFPLHPRTRKLIQTYGFGHLLNRLVVTDPLPFLDMVALEQSASLILTDSGGVQKEAFFYGVPCITMRDETEWVETVHSGWNKLTGADIERIESAFQEHLRTPPPLLTKKPYGEGNAAEKLLRIMLEKEKNENS
ncbi:UDP-N-acetyl glucosamine 2-epimerase [Hydrogenophaga crassostreae]|uniref:UDP-N-acetyl glucosamine 2-epimerase n=1 Tax=Hydrogenophaga crassostreae TaxID=1763535 RepID=A0A167H957_9BURK|nr:UDP-N-acetylglucosamine 2-epimerase (non-hydrolyzing) [Hydrogenophaga crassostreae]AOW12651.1 UDP-N-acetylglucosamine 2-epimerase [Hydrogenophaga crassostreae]OAD40522.1 UDP-N-acetyl glucosamine 2-epimerase [Hydrogenophaga crassostreae]